MSAIKNIINPGQQWSSLVLRIPLGIIFAAGVMVAGANALVPDTEELTRTFS